jgi:GWxTD domain-containing protein
MKKALSFLLGFFFLFLSCAAYQSEKNLTPEEKEFLSTVRYIIIKKERKTFLNLRPSERKTFIEEFWRKRDPHPETETNEFREEYYKRIEEANHLFPEGGKLGWLQERGRVYILLGPPERRATYPQGYSSYDPPMEIWFYGAHRLIFIDSYWSGNYELQTDSVRLVAEISAAQRLAKTKVEAEGVFFDFNLDIKKIAEGELLLLIEIPYENIWFAAEEEELKTTLEVTLEIFNASEKKVREETTSYPLSLSKEKFKDVLGKNYAIQIPIRLEPGQDSVTVTLKNLTGQSQVRKKIKLTA